MTPSEVEGKSGTTPSRSRSGMGPTGPAPSRATSVVGPAGPTPSQALSDDSAAVGLSDVFITFRRA
eukprot:1238192-Pleurochrysis_carterae.AAC.1